MESIKIFVRVKAKDKACAAPLPFTLSPRSLLERTGAVYEFDSVFDDWSQEEAFERIALPVVGAAFGGYNSTIFAYGQTGSGKTYTMEGEAGAEEGLIPRTLRHIYEVKGESAAVRISFIEIYNEKLTDLLGGASGLSLREDQDKGVVAEGLQVQECAEVEQAMDSYYRGTAMRTTAGTYSNERSSRSHSIFTIYLSVDTGMGITKVSKMNLVDLAGSERIHQEADTPGLMESGKEDWDREDLKRPRTDEHRAKEAGSINRSLLCLSRVISGLSDNQSGRRNRHVNYRDSKLTFLLKDSLGGSSKLVVIGTINSAARCIGESRNTLAFLTRVKLIRISPTINTEVDERIVDVSEHVRGLIHENARLREEKSALEEKIKELEGQAISKRECAAESNGHEEKVGAIERRVNEEIEKMGGVLERNKEALKDLEKFARDSEVFQQHLFEELRSCRLSEIERL